MFFLPLLVQAKRRIHHFMWWCVRLCHIERLVLSERHMKGFVSPHESQNSRILRLFHTFYCILKLCCFFSSLKADLNPKVWLFTFSFLPSVPTFLSYRTLVKLACTSHFSPPLLLFLSHGRRAVARKKFVSAGVHLAQWQMHSKEMKRMRIERCRKGREHG